MKKKKIYSGAFALALLVAATVGVQESKKNDVLLNDLALANVEALANGEAGNGDCQVYCTPSNTYKCIIMWPGAEGITCSKHRSKSN